MRSATNSRTIGMRGFAMPVLAAVLVMAAGAGPGTAADAPAASAVEEGREIAFDRRKGNCIACHVMAGATLPGTVGPPLVGMKARYPDRETLRMQIRDATQLNPRSLMPPFGRHRILTEDEIDKVVEYVLSL